jgi:hypothetical protein
VSETTQSRVQQSNGKVETSHHPETDPKRTEKNYYGIPPIKHPLASGESAPQPEDNI